MSAETESTPLALIDTESVTDLSRMELHVAMLEPSTPFVDVINARGLISQMIAKLRELDNLAELIAIQQVQRDGDQEINGVRYYVGVTKTEKPIELAKAAETCMQAVGGDWNLFVDLLSSNAFKPGACRKALIAAGVDFSSVFVTTSGDELREGKPKLQKFDPRFVK